MTAENFADYATTLLNGAITSTTSLTFSVTSGQGALFPTSDFLVSIDSEVFFIDSRSGDTFTVDALGRGFDGTTAATHSNGVSVQLTACAYNFKHLWKNVSDTYVPVVPPQQVGYSPSPYDNEFESQGAWSLYPGASGGTIFNAGTNLRSHLLLNRASGDTSFYTAYIAYPVTQVVTVTCKLSMGTSLVTTSAIDQAQFSLFVSDQSIPTVSADSGTRFKVQLVLANAVDSNNFLPGSGCQIRTIADTNGSASFVGPYVPYTAGAPVWFRLAMDTSGNWTSFFSSDGLVYWSLATRPGPSFSQASIGVSFNVYNPSHNFVAQTAAVDYVRVSLGTTEPPFGSPRAL